MPEPPGLLTGMYVAGSLVAVCRDEGSFNVQA